LAAGRGLSIIPVDAELTTQEAANFLNVSRPFVVELLESGKIRFRKVGTHRRIRFEDVLAYKQASFKDRSKALDELTALAQKHKLGY
jgi:excisionase family DNA binding protein